MSQTVAACIRTRWIPCDIFGALKQFLGCFVLFAFVLERKFFGVNTQIELKERLSVMEWSNEKYLDFIEDYRKIEVLWDVGCPQFKL